METVNSNVGVFLTCIYSLEFYSLCLWCIFNVSIYFFLLKVQTHV